MEAHGPVDSPSQTEGTSAQVTDLMTTSYLLMASPSELLRSRCPFPTTTQRRHLRLRWEMVISPRGDPCACAA